MLKPLPNSYGENRIIILPISPKKIHVFWDAAQVGANGQSKKSTLDLRIRIEQVVRGKIQTSGGTEKKVVGQEKNLYISLDAAGCSWQARLGFIDHKKKFQPLAVSNIIQLPNSVPNSVPNQPAPAPQHSPNKHFSTLETTSHTEQYKAVSFKLDRQAQRGGRNEAVSPSPSSVGTIAKSDRIISSRRPPIMIPFRKQFRLDPIKQKLAVLCTRFMQLFVPSSKRMAVYDKEIKLEAREQALAQALSSPKSRDNCSYLTTQCEKQFIAGISSP